MSASKLLYKYFVVGLFTTSLSCTNSNRKATAHATVSFRRNKWQLSYTFWANRSNLLPFYTKFLYTFPQRSSFASTNNNQNKNETFHHISRHDEREQTLNQMLVEMDGFGVNEGIIVMAATNRIDILDPAILRPGRFDRRVVVDRPDLKGREDILKVHLKNVKTVDDIDLKQVALGTSGCSGADIANMVNEAALRAVREGREKVIQEDLMEAIELVIAGKEKKDRIMTEKERKIVAYHEVGHALAIACQKNTQPVQKITIVPRTMGSLGYTMQMPEEERYLMTKDEMLDEITTLLAGRGAEEIIFNTVTTGASNDIERATAMARAMVTRFGMSEEFDMMALEKENNMYLNGSTSLICSDVTGSKADAVVLSIIKERHQKALDILKENTEALHKIADFLIQEETISGEKFMEIFNSVRAEKE